MNDGGVEKKVGLEAQRMLKYQEYLLDTLEYEGDLQRKLKLRVFNTFDRFLQFCGQPGLIPNVKLLDLGAADRSFVQLCSEKGLFADGIDIDDGINLLSDPLPFENNSLDIITANSVIEHLSSPENMLREVLRILRPGGTFLLVTPNWKYSFKEFYDDPTHVRPFTTSTIEAELLMHGFSKVCQVPWLVSKPDWMWRIPCSFQLARWLPFRGDAANWIPVFLKGRTKSLMAMARKPILD